jgi:HEPN domain-containing protein
MSTALVIASFLRIARGDLDDAVRLADGPSRNAAYLCEQAAEKSCGPFSPRRDCT